VWNRDLMGMGILALSALAAVVVVPLAREYADFRRSWGLGRTAALGLTAVVLPAVGVGIVVATPLAEWPLLQWGATVAAALGVYSLAVRAVEAALVPERASHSR